MADKKVGLVGATSFVGERVQLLLVSEGYSVRSFSRLGGNGTMSLQEAVNVPPSEIIEDWIYLAPIWTLPDYFGFLQKHGVKRLVALSSTSRYTKAESGSSTERAVAQQLQQGEEKVMEWAEANHLTAVILESTLIYGMGKDRNVTEVARIIQRFGFFPLFGPARGLRQPIHVDDVAKACLAALNVPNGSIRNYVLSGADVITYRTMVERIFIALGRKPRFLRCPLALFSLATRFATLFYPDKELTTEMALRMNRDQQFDHAAAKVELGFKPRGFNPLRSDVIMER